MLQVAGGNPKYDARTNEKDSQSSSTLTKGPGRERGRVLCLTGSLRLATKGTLMVV
jgi:hypothetical protein